MSRIDNLDQGTSEWLAWRRGGHGASDAPLVMRGRHFDRTLADLLAEARQVAAGGEPPPPRASSWVMERGKRFETYARGWYERLYGVMAPACCWQHDTHDWLRASLDGYITPPGIVLEIKYANRDDHAVALAGKVPDKYLPQLWHQALVTGCNRFHYLSGNDRTYTGADQLVVVPFVARQEDIDELLRRWLLVRAAVLSGEDLPFIALQPGSRGCTPPRN